MDREADHIAALALLNEPLRRRIYDHIAEAEQGVSREGTAAALGVARSVATFHLEKLVDAGLVEVDYRRPAGRGGPGAGRPAKWYRRAPGEITASVPERRYDLAATLLARAVERAAGAGDVLAEIAREHGQRIGAGLRLADGESSPVFESLVALLAGHGYEPRVSANLISLVNCPFHVLTEEHRDLVCHLNYQLICGLAEAAGLSPGAAKLDPGAGRCCVTLMRETCW